MQGVFEDEYGKNLLMVMRLGCFGLEPTGAEDYLQNAEQLLSKNLLS
jgi:hypothetical protein